jgi:hypothetical protein
LLFAEESRAGTTHRTASLVVQARAAATLMSNLHQVELTLLPIEFPKMVTVVPPGEGPVLGLIELSLISL